MGAAKIGAATLLLALTSSVSADAPDPSWIRAEKLVAQMTLAEKVQLLQGTAKAAGPDPEVKPT